jgi:hypothetical protein
MGLMGLIGPPISLISPIKSYNPMRFLTSVLIAGNNR